MEFFGILHWVQDDCNYKDDSNYKDDCNSTSKRRLQQHQQIPFGDDNLKSNGSEAGGGFTSHPSR